MRPGLVPGRLHFACIFRDMQLALAGLADDI